MKTDVRIIGFEYRKDVNILNELFTQLFLLSRFQ